MLPAAKESRGAQNYARMNSQSVSAEHRGETDYEQVRPPAAPAAHTRYLLLPAAATLPEKTEGFVPRPPTEMEPTQHPHNNDNAFCSIIWLTRISLPWQ